MPPFHNSRLHLDLKGGHDIHAPYDALSAICATDLPPWLCMLQRPICILPKEHSMQPWTLQNHAPHVSTASSCCCNVLADSGSTTSGSACFRVHSVRSRCEH